MSVANGIVGQLRRFATVGVFSNFLLYVAYLGLTTLGMAPILVMSLLYAVGVGMTYIINNRWSFSMPRLCAGSFARYMCAHGLGYGCNLGLLWLFVDHLHWPHQVVQAIAIIIVALLLFGLNRYWVFVRPAESGA